MKLTCFDISCVDPLGSVNRLYSLGIVRMMQVQSMFPCVQNVPNECGYKVFDVITCYLFHDVYSFGG